VTTHYMDEAEVLCDRVAIVDHGKIIALDTPKAL
jgi:ABC-2 type transport system ATP-binding protein